MSEAILKIVSAGVINESSVVIALSDGSSILLDSNKLLAYAKANHIELVEDSDAAELPIPQ